VTSPAGSAAGMWGEMTQWLDSTQCLRTQRFSNLGGDDYTGEGEEAPRKEACGAAGSSRTHAGKCSSPPRKTSLSGRKTCEITVDMRNKWRILSVQPTGDIPLGSSSKAEQKSENTCVLWITIPLALPGLCIAKLRLSTTANKTMRTPLIFACIFFVAAGGA